MRALYLEHGQLHYREDVKPPDCQAHEALIRVDLAGICATDLALVKGYAGFSGIPGHEFVGHVVASPDETWLGARVVGSINLGCGHCHVCQTQGPAHCQQRQVLGIRGKPGAFAEYLSLPLGNLHVVPEHVSNVQAVFTEPLAAAVNVAKQTEHLSPQKVALIGAGRLGFLIAQVMAVRFPDLVVMGRRDASLDVVRRLGLATMLVDDAVDQTFDLVIESSGHTAGLAQALRIVRAQGTIVLKSTFADKVSLDLSPIVVREIQVLGSRCGPFEDALHLLASDAIQVAPLIDAEYALEDGLEAFLLAAKPGIRKVLLRT